MINPFTKYFATIALDEAHELSLFVSLNYDEGAPESLWKNTTRLHASESPLVQCVMHAPARRSASPYLASNLSSHSLKIEDEIPDVTVEPGGELLLPSKVGGRPYYYYFKPDYMKAIDRLLDEGFIYLLQLTWAGPNSPPNGEWPFFEFTFHLLARETPQGIVWRYGWG